MPIKEMPNNCTMPVQRRDVEPSKCLETLLRDQNFFRFQLMRGDPYAKDKNTSMNGTKRANDSNPNEITMCSRISRNIRIVKCRNVLRLCSTLVSSTLISSTTTASSTLASSGKSAQNQSDKSSRSGVWVGLVFDVCVCWVCSFFFLSLQFGSLKPFFLHRPASAQCCRLWPMWARVGPF